MAARHRISTPNRRPTEACRRTTATPGGINPAPVRALLLDVEGGPEDCPGHEAHWRGTASASERTDAPYRQTRATGDVRTAAFARTDDRGSRNLGARRADQDRTALVPVVAIDEGCRNTRWNRAAQSPAHDDTSLVRAAWWRDAEASRRDEGTPRRDQSPLSRDRGTISADHVARRRVRRRRPNGPRHQLTGPTPQTRRPGATSRRTSAPTPGPAARMT